MRTQVSSEHIPSDACSSEVKVMNDDQDYSMKLKLPLRQYSRHLAFPRTRTLSDQYSWRWDTSYFRLQS